jgi:hypothetical protein
LIWIHEIKDTPVLLQFLPNDSFLIAATRRSHAIGSACNDGKVLKKVVVPNQQAPLNIAISPDCGMIAFVYRGRAVLLWTPDNDQLLGACGGKVGSIDMISNSLLQ